MQITNEEKEELFKEFKSRMGKERLGHASGYTTLHNLEPAKDYFWKKYNSMTKEFEFDTWSEKGIVSADWDKIRQLVCHAYGVSIVKDIPFEKLDSANKLGKEMIDMLFECNYELLKEEEP